jgi:hypothetical protein
LKWSCELENFTIVNYGIQKGSVNILEVQLAFQERFLEEFGDTYRAMRVTFRITEDYLKVIERITIGF